MTLFLLLSLQILFATEKHNVCSITINSDDEIKLFKKHLNPSDFNFIELTDVVTAEERASESVPADWFGRVCEKDIRCDVLVVSGHFGGSFFGDSGINLPLDELEKHGCDGKCQGILNSAKEVFLLGCNTLASKEKDHRTPEEYLAVLLEDGIERSQAERIVQARYGALGDSFKDRMQRVFENVPNIYGFTSVGPSGKTISPFLTNYFRRIGNYKDHLIKIQTQGIVDLIDGANKAVSKINNTVLAEALSVTAYEECAGITPADPAYRVKRDICRIYNQDIDAKEKVGLIETLLESEDALLYLPTISSFLNENSLIDLGVLKNNSRIRKLLQDIAKSFADSPLLYLDIMKLQCRIGFESMNKCKDEYKNTILSQSKKITRESADIVCSIESEHYDLGESVLFDVKDIEASKINTIEGLGVLGCMNFNLESHNSIMQELLKTKNGKWKGEEKYLYMHILGKFVTPESAPEVVAMIERELNTATDDFRMLLVNALLNVHKQASDATQLERLYQRDFSVDSTFADHIRSEALAIAAREQKMTPFLYSEIKKSITEPYGNPDLYYAFNTKEKVAELRNIIMLRDMNLDTFVSTVSAIEINKRPIPSPLLDLYLDGFIASEFAYTLQFKDQLNEEQKNRLLESAKKDPTSLKSRQIIEQLD